MMRTRTDGRPPFCNILVLNRTRRTENTATTSCLSSLPLLLLVRVSILTGTSELCTVPGCVLLQVSSVVISGYWQLIMRLLVAVRGELLERGGPRRRTKIARAGYLHVYRVASSCPRWSCTVGQTVLRLPP
ncbi:hypothetical protein OH77DRAFT_806557 [Trametes cingulata]|nr:hypothetical protein OH77DRAFT_806557 [Trametes cingulata]